MPASCGAADAPVLPGTGAGTAGHAAGKELIPKATLFLHLRSRSGTPRVWRSPACRTERKCLLFGDSSRLPQTEGIWGSEASSAQTGFTQPSDARPLVTRLRYTYTDGTAGVQMSHTSFHAGQLSCAPCPVFCRALFRSAASSLHTSSTHSAESAAPPAPTPAHTQLEDRRRASLVCTCIVSLYL